MKPKYKRVLIKVSGEAMAGEQKHGINEEMTTQTAKMLKEVVDAGVQVAVVVGGGNFWRGRSSEKMNRASADYIGMMATIMNALALQEALEAEGVSTVVQTSIQMPSVAFWRSSGVKPTAELPAPAAGKIMSYLRSDSSR